MTDQPIEDPKRSRVRRIGCTIAVILWFLLLLVPCFVVVLATRGEITIPTGNTPNQQTRLWLVMEARSRGLGLSTASIHAADDLMCVQTDVRFLLWQGQADPVSYCECYNQNDDFVSSTSGTCPGDD